MTRLIRVELLKIRTTRLSYGLLATGAGLTALFSVLEASRAGTEGTSGRCTRPRASDAIGHRRRVDAAAGHGPRA